jgi:hypothetical protein
VTAPPSSGDVSGAIAAAGSTSGGAGVARTPGGSGSVQSSGSSPESGASTISGASGSTSPGASGSTGPGGSGSATTTRFFFLRRHFRSRRVERAELSVPHAEENDAPVDQTPTNLSPGSYSGPETG